MQLHAGRASKTHIPCASKPSPLLPVPHLPVSAPRAAKLACRPLAPPRASPQRPFAPPSRVPPSPAHGRAPYGASPWPSHRSRCAVPGRLPLSPPLAPSRHRSLPALRRRIDAYSTATCRMPTDHARNDHPRAQRPPRSALRTLSLSSVGRRGLLRQPECLRSVQVYCLGVGGWGVSTGPAS